MGAENSILHDCVWGESYQSEPWEIENGRLANDDEISLFRLRTKERLKEDLLRALTKQLRSLRHPYILHYVGFEEGSNGPCLITEKVVPLEIRLPKMSSSEICAGLHNVLEGLEFLHDRAKISHNNIHAGCLYVSSDGSWRLGGLEHACHFTAVTQQRLEATKKIRQEDTLTPEELEGNLVTDVQYGHSRDVYAFAVMTEAWMQKLDNLGDLTKTFELRIQDECLNKDPKLRPKVGSLLQDRLFTTEFLEIASFLKHVPLKSELERKEFFKSLLPKLRNLPEELIAQRLVTSLLSRFVMLDPTATQCILPSLLVPRSDDDDTRNKNDNDFPLFSEALFKKHVIPHLVRIFAVRDYHVHLHLLKFFPDFVHLVDPEILEDNVFPHVLLGLRDTSNDISALSLHALAEMVPILGREIIIGGQSKSFYKKAMPNHDKMSHSPQNMLKQNNHVQKGKVRLKELATHSVNHVKEDKDTKIKEKEKKREEMRKRREERKAAREKSKLKEKEIQVSREEKTNTSQSENIISTCSDDIPESQQFHNQSNGTPSLHPSGNRKHSNQSGEPSEENVTETGSPQLSVQHSDTESYSAETADVNNEWEDWDREEIGFDENFKGHNSNKPAHLGGFGDMGDHSDISDEIEKELQNMTVESDTLSASSSEKSAFNSIKKPSKNALKLVSKKKKSEEKPKVDHNVVISEIEKSVKGHGSARDKNKFTSAKTTQVNKRDKDLGSEFEIKSINIKVPPVVEDPFDFFADMAPTISSKNVSDVLKDAGRDLDKPAIDVAMSKVSFGVTVSTIEDTEEGAGWGEDDW